MRIPKSLIRMRRRTADFLHGSAVALAYHRVADVDPDSDPHRLCISPERFSEHCAAIADRFNTPTLSEVVTALRTGTVLPRRSVCITFDDGYRDTFTAALPILECSEIPLTVFVSTRNVCEQHPPYWDELLALLPDREAYFAWCAKLEKLSPDARDEQIALLRKAQGTPSSALTAGGCSVTADELSTFARHQLVTIGGHTHRHPLLTVLSAEQMQAEIETNQLLLEPLIGYRPSLFAYPYGTADSFDTTTVAVVQSCGYHAGFTTQWGQIRLGRDLFRLPRIDIASLDVDEALARIESFFGTS